MTSIPSRENCELNQTVNPLEEEIFKEPLGVVKGEMTLPDMPGFGVELIDDIDMTFPYLPVRNSMIQPAAGGQRDDDEDEFQHELPWQHGVTSLRRTGAGASQPNDFRL